MDINSNTNTLSHQPVGSTTVKIDKTKQPADSSESAGVLRGESDKISGHSERDLQQAVAQLNDFAQTIQRNLHFSIDKESGILITKVVDSKSNEVIRQIPSEETVALAHSLASLEHGSEFNIFKSRA